MEESFHRYIELARTIHIRCILGGEITQYMVIYDIFLRLWPIQQVQPCVNYRCLFMIMKTLLCETGVPVSRFKKKCMTYLLRDAYICALRRKLLTCPINSQVIFHREAVPRWFICLFFCLQHNIKFFLACKLMDLSLTDEDQSQADQPNSLADGPPM